MTVALLNKVLHSLPKRIGSGVSRPTVDIAYASRRNPSCKILIAALVSRLCSVPHSGQVHCRTLRSFVPGHCVPQAEQS